MIRKWFQIFTIAALLAFILPSSSYMQASGAALKQFPYLRHSNRISDDEFELAESSVWRHECVDCPKRFFDMSDRSLQLDADGNAHIAYGGKGLYYARYDDSAWHTEIVDHTPGVGGNASLALDTNGYAHISYTRVYSDGLSSYYALKYAFQDPTGWHIQTLDSEGGGKTSLALDKEGYPHISYQGFYQSTPDHELRYAFLDAQGWHIETVDQESPVGNDSSIALDKDGNPHISYTDEVNPDLHYAFKDGSGWQLSVVDSVGWVGLGSSIALDEGGYPHISYRDDGNYKLKYAFKSVSGWQIQTLNQPDAVKFGTSLVLDHGGYPHISYTAGGLKYAFQDSNGWQYQTVSNEGAQYISLDLDADQQPHISYTTPQLASEYEQMVDLKYSTRNQTGWHVETVDSEGQVYERVSPRLVIDQSGMFHTSYTMVDYEDSEASVLKYALRESAVWQVHSLVSGSVVGRGASLAVDKHGFPHLSYFTGLTQDYGMVNDLNYIFQDDQGWHPLNVGTAQGFSSALALDADSTPRISFSTKEDLQYASLADGGWEFETIYPWPYGSSQSMVLDNQGYAHIILNYEHETVEGIFHIAYAYQDATGWHTEKVSTGYVASLALDQQGRPHISYLSNGVIHAYRDDTGWQSELVDAQGNRAPSIALDTNGYTHISYGEGFYCVQKNGPTVCGSYLKYAYKDELGWHIEVVDIGGDFGSDISLALDEQDQPHLMFFDSRNGDLKYIYRQKFEYEAPLDPLENYAYSMPGNTISHFLHVTNASNQPDTYKITISNNTWTVDAPATIGPLNIGESTTLNLQITIPPTATLGSSDTATITLTSQNDPSVTATATLTTYAAITTYLPLVVR